MGDIVNDLIKKNEEQFKSKVLDALGLFEYEKEYAPSHLDGYRAREMGYGEVENMEGKLIFYRKGVKKYPEVSDEQLEKLVEIYNAKVLEEEKDRARMDLSPKTMKDLEIKADSTFNNTFAARFFQVIGFVCWIGGLIISFTSSFYTQLGVYSDETKFNFTHFLMFAIVFFVAGGLCMCMSEVCKNIGTISSAIQNFTVKEKRQ